MRGPASAVLALTVRKPETLRLFLDAAGKHLQLLPSDVPAYTGIGEVFIVTNLNTTVIGMEQGKGDEHSGQEIIIIQLEVRD